MSRTFRTTFASPYNTRVSAVNASDTSTAYAGVAIAGIMIAGKTSPSVGKDARFINCFTETVADQATGKRRIYMTKRPGFGTQSTPASGKKGYQILVWSGKGAGTDVVSAFDSPSTLYNGTASLGALSGKCTGISETVVGTTPTIAVSSDDNTGWYYDTGVGVMTKIVSGNFPGNAGYALAGTFAHLDGFAGIATNDGKVWASDLNSMTGWTANSFDSSNAYPDGGIALIRHKSYWMNFGSESIQFYYNAGLTPFPFAKAHTMTIKVGAISADAIAEISDTKFWAGSTAQGGLTIFQYDGSLSRISTPEIDAILILAGASNISLTTIRFYGRSFVLIRAGATTFAYCVEERMWHEWSSTTPLWYKCAALQLGGTMVNYAVSNVDTSGKVFLMNHASLVFTDNGTTYSATAQLPNNDHGTRNKKYCSSVEVLADVEVTASPFTLTYSDDDFLTRTTFATGDLSNQRNRFTRAGSFRRRSWGVTHSAATPMRLEALQGEIEIGPS